MKERTIPRFPTAVRAFHWIYFIAFLVLAVTGAILFLPWTAFAAGEAGQTTKLLHRIFGVALLVAPILVWLAARRPFSRDVAEGFKWGKEDATSLRILLTKSYWTGEKDGLPKQGKFMAGQKLNVLVQTLTFFVLAGTGVALWFGKGVLPQGVMQLMALVHALAAVLATLVAIIHIYMVTTMPFTRDAIGSMFTGKMSEELARSHHTRWYEEMTEQRRAGEKT